MADLDKKLDKDVHEDKLLIMVKTSRLCQLMQTQHTIRRISFLIIMLVTVILWILYLVVSDTHGMDKFLNSLNILFTGSLAGILSGWYLAALYERIKK